MVVLKLFFIWAIIVTILVLAAVIIAGRKQ